METVACNHGEERRLQREPRPHSHSQLPVLAVAATEATDRDMQGAELVFVREEKLPIYKFNTSTTRSGDEPLQLQLQQQAGLPRSQRYDRQVSAGPHHCCHCHCHCHCHCRYQPCSSTHMHRCACACACGGVHHAIGVCLCCRRCSCCATCGCGIGRLSASTSKPLQHM